LNDELDRLEQARHQLEDARAVHARKRRTLERVRSRAEEGDLDAEQMAKLAEAEEDLDREVALHDVQARKLELEAMRLRQLSREGR
jgi:hypothetical protein